MHEYHVKRLAVRVEAVNLLNTLITQVHADLVPVFQAAIGQKIVKQDGSWTAKFRPKAKAVILKHEYRHGHIWHSVHQLFTEVSVHVKVCVDRDGHCVYEDRGFDICSVDLDGKCIRVMENLRNGDLRTDWTVGEIVAAHDKVVELQDQIDKLMSPHWQFLHTNNSRVGVR